MSFESYFRACSYAMIACGVLALAASGGVGPLLAAADAAGQVYAGVSALVHFTLLLSSIKLLQVKSDRDWLFLYLISFFEVLLAAGLSASPTFLVSLGLYGFTALLAVVCFELRKSSRAVPPSESR